MFTGFPYWRIAGNYFLYFAALGVLLPFWPLYLHLERGFDLQTIGFLAAIMAVAKVLMPNVLAWFAEYTSINSIVLLRCAGFAAALFFALVPFIDNAVLLALVLFLYASCLTSSLPQLEAITMRLLGSLRHQYTRIRLWGSIGFTVVVLATGMWLEKTSLLLVVPWLIVAIMLLFAANNLLLPLTLAASGNRGGSGTMMDILRRPGIITLLAACCLLQLSHGPYYTYFSILMDSHGYSARTISHLWVLGVLAEIVLYTMVHKLWSHFSLRQLLLAAMWAAVLRWLLVAFYADNLWVMLPTQILHAMTFGVFHAAIIQCIHSNFPGHLQARGQALYSSTSFGLGLAIGHAGAAVLWQQVGATATFVVAAVVSLAAVALLLRVPRSILL